MRQNGYVLSTGATADSEACDAMTDKTSACCEHGKALSSTSVKLQIQSMLSLGTCTASMPRFSDGHVLTMLVCVTDSGAAMCDDS